MPWLFGIPSFHPDSLKEMLKTAKGKLKSKPGEPSTLVSQCCSQQIFDRRLMPSLLIPELGASNAHPNAFSSYPCHLVSVGPSLKSFSAQASTRWHVMFEPF